MTEPASKTGMSKVIDWVIIAVIVGLLGFAFFANQESNPTTELVGQPAPTFKIQAQSGKVVDLEALSGKVVVMDFWATWCGPCKKQMPALQELERDGTEDLVVLSVNTDDPTPDRRGKVTAFLDVNDYEFDVLYDQGPISGKYRVTRIPTIVVVSPMGKVTYADSGVLSLSKLRSLVDEARVAN